MPWLRRAWVELVREGGGRCDVPGIVEQQCGRKCFVSRVVFSRFLSSTHFWLRKKAVRHLLLIECSYWGLVNTWCYKLILLRKKDPWKVNEGEYILFIVQNAFSLRRAHGSGSLGEEGGGDEICVDVC